jgi:hypothetical protein
MDGSRSSNAVIDCMKSEDMKLVGRSDRLGCGWLGGFEAGGTEGVPFGAGDCVILELMVLGVGGAVPCALPVGLDEDPPWPGAAGAL